MHTAMLWTLLILAFTRENDSFFYFPPLGDPQLQFGWFQRQTHSITYIYLLLIDVNFTYCKLYVHLLPRYKYLVSGARSSVQFCQGTDHQSRVGTLRLWDSLKGNIMLNLIFPSIERSISANWLFYRYKEKKY